jgi:hypothetical protein
VRSAAARGPNPLAAPQSVDTMEPHDLVTVYSVNNPTHAEIIRNFLQREGIACELGGEKQMGLTGIMQIDILVRAEDADRAGKLIAQHEEEQGSKEQGTEEDQ